MNDKKKSIENKNKKTKKIKIKKVPALILLVLLVIFIIFLVYLKSGDTKSKYGNRLTGIEKVPFKKEQIQKITNKIKENENVQNENVRLQGKIIYISFNVNEDLSVDDAKNIGNGLLEVIDGNVKNFYDINITITKTDEKGEEVTTTDDSGNQVTKTVKSFPIMGYKKQTSPNIVW